MPARTSVRVADCFLLAMNAFMRRHGQGAQITASLLVLETAPDLGCVRRALVRMAEKHPLLAGRLHRSWRTWLPYWEVPDLGPGAAVPFGLWREKGSPGALGGEAGEVASARAQIEEGIAEPLSERWNARFDLIERCDGSCLLVLSWSHLIIDGKGAELLLAELARLCAGVDEPCEAKEQLRPETTWQEKVRKTKPAIFHLEALAKLPMRSVCGPKPRPGRCHFQVVTLDAAATEKVRARVEQTTGALFPLAFYVACAARAHDRVLGQRGTAPAGYVTTVPVQTRKRGARGPLFHNHVSVLFFGGPREQLASIEAAAAAMKQQFAEMTRARLEESFTNVLELMMRAPSWLFMFIVRHQFRGEICSFFQSHTGTFAPEIVELAGARVGNAYHLPCVSAPPGSGIFFCEHGGRLNVTFSWRDGCLTGDERRLLVAQTLEDLVGEPRPDLADAGL
jgi:hypothetical protein